MTTALLNETPLLIMPSLACHIGLNESIMLQQVHYWLVNAQKANDKAKFNTGRWWTYNSYKEWRENNFPFWSIRTIQRIVANLEKKGLLLKREDADLKAKGGSRTWYSIDYEKLETIEKGKGYRQVDQGVSSSCLNPSGQVGNTFTESTTETTEDKELADTPTAVSAGEVETPDTPQDAPAPKPPTAQQAMFDAVCRVWGYALDKLTPSKKKAVGLVASELVAGHARPDQIPAFKEWLDAKAEADKWASYTVYAMKSYWTDYAVTLPSETTAPDQDAPYLGPDGVWVDPKFDQRFAGLDVIEANELRDKILLEQLEKTFGGAK